MNAERRAVIVYKNVVYKHEWLS